jgi:hypothetical protein
MSNTKPSSSSSTISLASVAIGSGILAFITGYVVARQGKKSKVATTSCSSSASCTNTNNTNKDASSFVVGTQVTTTRTTTPCYYCTRYTTSDASYAPHNRVARYDLGSPAPRCDAHWRFICDTSHQPPHYTMLAFDHQSQQLFCHKCSSTSIEVSCLAKLHFPRIITTI